MAAKFRKVYNPNKVARRKRRPIIYIICEGKETETLYFRHFRSRNCLVDVIPISSKHKAAEHLVKHAQALISQSDYYPEDGDQLWCVFDCDDNKNQELHQEKAIERAKERVEYLRKEHIEIVHRDSNPVTTVYELVEFLNSKRSI